LSATATQLYAGQVQILAVNYASQPLNRVAIVLPAVVRHRTFTLSNPSRLVIDLENTRLPKVISAPPAGHPLFVNTRSGIHNQQDLRMVFELNADADAHTTVVNQGNSVQLQLDLAPRVKPAAAPLKPDAPSPAPGNAARPEPAVTLAKPVNRKVVPLRGRDLVVAIDAGHGGKDVGAQGSNGTQEKDVVFAIAKRLESLVNRQPGMRAVMVRQGDNFVYLRERVNIAEAAKADLLVSIHADAFADPSVQGASVYTLSKKGASSQFASRLAASENAADLEGADRDYKDDTLASVLQDLSNNAAKEASQNVGNKVLKSVNAVSQLHRNTVQKAQFVVLKSADIPSILVETAFISNPDEERRLSSSTYQEKMATAVFRGILAHFKQYAPANTLLAQLSKAHKPLKLAAKKFDGLAADKV